MREMSKAWRDLSQLVRELRQSLRTLSKPEPLIKSLRGQSRNLGQPLRIEFKLNLNIK